MRDTAVNSRKLPVGLRNAFVNSRKLAAGLRDASVNSRKLAALLREGFGSIFIANSSLKYIKMMILLRIS
ncbi:hypothetical protein [Kordia sp.]|uniref:hypothetical protein n=1 Tax=Kordia sp. TaxID=1965332 RepID=UPI003D2CADF8